jgi:hypothetical protein
MRNRHLFPVLAWSLGVLCLLSISRSAHAAEVLFNGKNLDGWRYYLVDHAVGMEDVWSVRDGVIVCKGDPLGYLYTKKAFKNYRLQVEWRWPEKPGNSGLFQRINAKPGFLPRCMEVQLQHGNAGDIYAFQGMPLSGDPARFRNIKHKELGDFLGVSKISDNEKEPGQWNLAEVVVDGSTIKVWVNGKLVNEATNCEVVAGPIGLQSEGGVVEFRKVEVTPLPD